MKISRIWTSITSLKTRQQPRYPLKNDQSHPLYHPLYQKFIPAHHLAPKKNNSQMKNLTLSKSTNLTPVASQLSTTRSSTATLKSKAPTTNHKSPRLTRKLSSSPLKSLSLIPSTPQQLSQQHTCLHSLSPPCSPEQVRSQWTSFHKIQKR